MSIVFFMTEQKVTYFSNPLVPFKNLLIHFILYQNIVSSLSSSINQLLNLQMSKLLHMKQQVTQLRNYDFP